MREQGLKHSWLTTFLKTIDSDDRDAEVFLKSENAEKYVEASDLYRLHDLLHRDEYQPVAVIRFLRNGETTIRVYFQQLHTTQFDVVPLEEEPPSRLTEHYQLT